MEFFLSQGYFLKCGIMLYKVDIRMVDVNF